VLQEPRFQPHCMRAATMGREGVASSDKCKGSDVIRRMPHPPRAHPLRSACCAGVLVWLSVRLRVGERSMKMESSDHANRVRGLEYLSHLSRDRPAMTAAGRRRL
jgi:hypothetical protein